MHPYAASVGRFIRLYFLCSIHRLRYMYMNGSIDTAWRMAANELLSFAATRRNNIKFRAAKLEILSFLQNEKPNFTIL